MSQEEPCHSLLSNIIAYLVTFGEQKGGLDIPILGLSSPPFVGYVRVNLTLADSEHLGAAYRACALGCRPAVFHGYTLGPLNLPLGLALHTVTLHSLPP